jgi:translocation and assembly module TamB
LRRFGFILALVAASVLAAFAQDGEESNGFIIDLIQDSLSSDNRQIRIRGIDGLLASDAKVEEITVSDREGVWLTIQDADIVWTRRALFSKRLKIDSLSAKSIEILRQPAPDPSLPTLEAEPFSLPELPLSVEIGSLSVARMALGETLIGEAAELSIAGAISLIDGSLDAELDLNRLDKAGSFKLGAGFEAASRELNVDLAFNEPEGGLVANLLKIEGRPAMDVTVTGAGPLEDIDLRLDASTNGSPAIVGDLRLREGDQGLRFDTNISGQLAGLMPRSLKARARLRRPGRQGPVAGLILMRSILQRRL